MANELIDLNILPIETLAEMANEKAELVEKNARKTVSDAIDCGRYLTAIKDQIEHGKWAAWLGANWNYSQSLANKYMTISNSERVTNLKDATTIREALRMIGDDREEKSIPPRADRIPDRVEVVESTSEPGQPDPDPTPDPPTIRKTAKGTEKVSEDKKPRTQPIVPEVMAGDEMEIAKVDPVAEYFERATIDEIVTRIIQRAENAYDQKKTAKAFRKLADKLDPPDETAGAIPKASELKSHIPDELPESIDASLWQFVKLKQGYKDRKWRYQSVDQFAGDMKRLKNKLKALGEQKVERMLLDAFDKGWRHWDHDTSSGKANGNGHTESLADRVASKAARLKDIFG